jgi:hypothetical protein
VPFEKRGLKQKETVFFFFLVHQKKTLNHILKQNNQNLKFGLFHLLFVKIELSKVRPENQHAQKKEYEVNLSISRVWIVPNQSTESHKIHHRHVYKIFN